MIVTNNRVIWIFENGDPAERLERGPLWPRCAKDIPSQTRRRGDRCGCCIRFYAVYVYRNSLGAWPTKGLEGRKHIDEYDLEGYGQGLSRLFFSLL